METKNVSAPSPAPPQPPVAPTGSYTSLPGAKIVMCDKLGLCLSAGGAPSFSLPSPTRSLPDKLEYGLLDETVCDWDCSVVKPSHIDVEDVEQGTFSELG
jgi:hypothetical protein